MYEVQVNNGITAFDPTTQRVIMSANGIPHQQQ
jgi:hypothetical protein